jgi:dTDP-4-dehydrorhamnose reductase
MQHPLIIGNGYLATVLESSLPGSKAIGFPHIDMTDLKTFTEQVKAFNPTIIINAAAFTDTTAAELPENAGKVFALNVQGPANIAYIARELNIPWVHFSTGMFFDGENAVTEDDVPEPQGYYAWTKAWADALLLPRAELDKTLILRIHLPISAIAHPRNFLNRMVKFEKAVAVKSSVTVVEDLIAAMQHLLVTEQYGLYNAVNTGTISSLEIAELLYKHNLRPTPPSELTLEELDAMGGAKQVFPTLSNTKLTNAGFRMPDVFQSVENAIKSYSIPL